MSARRRSHGLNFEHVARRSRANAPWPATYVGVPMEPPPRSVSACAGCGLNRDAFPSLRAFKDHMDICDPKLG